MDDNGLPGMKTGEKTDIWIISVIQLVGGCSLLDTVISVQLIR
jgi:hypothetical protein